MSPPPCHGSSAPASQSSSSSCRCRRAMDEGTRPCRASTPPHHPLPHPVQPISRQAASPGLLDVKPWDDETDMKKLEEVVRSVQMEGLTWGASKLVPVGYGIKKMTIMLTIVDDLVFVDSLIEEHLTEEPINEYVQSCDIVAFNKI